MTNSSRSSFVDDLVLPTLLFAALGGMTWAVRGCSGFGATPGCLFAGVMWGAAWWFIARDPMREQSRRYASGWIVLAVTVGVGLSGARGWMQWPSFFEGKLGTNYGAGEFVPISRAYGFLWLFIAGVPWAGIGACMLAWCGSLRETRAWHWVLRIACGIGGGLLARYLFDTYPQYFLPLYDSLEERYKDFEANPSLKRLINDSGAAIVHLGYYLGFLVFEIARRDVKNVVLIVTVGFVNGAGWALCQNWKWAPGVWTNSTFNFWRCWESSGGISIGIAYGIAYFLVNRRMSDRERAFVSARREIAGPNYEWWLTFSGLAAVLSLYLRGQMGGWGNLYFSVLLVFALLYYFVNRRTSLAEPCRAPQWRQLPANIEWGALALAAALLAGLYIGVVVDVSPREMLRLGPIYVGVVMALGLTWYAIRRTAFDAERAANTPSDGDPNLERLGLALGLLAGLGLSIRNGLKGWFNIYAKSKPEEYWSGLLWEYLGPAFLVILFAVTLWAVFRPIPLDERGNLFPHAHRLMWLVLLVQNVLGQLVTGPLTEWNEMAFSIYYLLLLVITAVIVLYYDAAKGRYPQSD